MMNRIDMKRNPELCLAVVALVSAMSSFARADVVTEWNQNAQQALLTAKTSPVVSTRVLAIVHGEMFDAVKGIERRDTPIHVDFDAPPGASRRAAAIQAAYATLVKLFPSQKSTLDAQRDASLNSIASEEAVENSQSIARGLEWGQQVADDILAWRSTDGFTPAPPPFFGGTDVGQWRPTPPGFLPGALPQWAHMTPWAMSSPDQFRPLGPPALTDRKSTRLNSSHGYISYAVFCLKKKNSDAVRSTSIVPSFHHTCIGTGLRDRIREKNPASTAVIEKHRSRSTLRIPAGGHAAVE